MTDRGGRSLCGPDRFGRVVQPLESAVERRISPVGEFDQHLRVAPLRRAPPDEVLAAQLVQRRHERRLPRDLCAVFRNHLVARSVATDDERIAPFAGPADIDAIRSGPFANLPGV